MTTKAWVGSGWWGSLAVAAALGLAVFAAAASASAQEAAEATAPRVDECRRLADAAAAVDPDEISEGAWPYETLTPALQEAAETAVLGGDPLAACHRFAETLGGDRAAAATLLAVTFAELVDAFPDECYEMVTPALESGLLEVLAAHPGSPDWTAVAALHYGDRVQRCPASVDALFVQLESLGEAGAEAAADLAHPLTFDDPIRRRLLVYADEKAPRRRTALLVDLADDLAPGYSLTHSAILEAALASAGDDPARRAEVAPKLLVSLLDAGRAADALVVWEREGGQALLAALPEYPDRRFDLAAAALLTGRQEQARAWLAQAIADRAAPAWKPQLSGLREEPPEAQALLGPALAVLLGGEHPDPWDLFASLALAFPRQLAARDTLLLALASAAERSGLPAIAAYLRAGFETTIAAETAFLDDPDGPLPEGFTALREDVRELLPRFAHEVSGDDRERAAAEVWAAVEDRSEAGGEEGGGEDVVAALESLSMQTTGFVLEEIADGEVHVHLFQLDAARERAVVVWSTSDMDGSGVLVRAEGNDWSYLQSSLGSYFE